MPKKLFELVFLFYLIFFYNLFIACLYKPPCYLTR